ncbi:MAG: AraC family transcriptional regulator [Pseudomonadales bacterium]|nr:AraC family transcriptional regulator [Pseudomonadales bacterium]
MPEALTYDVPLISTRYAYRFFKFLKSKQISPEVIRAHCPVPRDLLENPDAFLSMNQVIPILETAQWLLSDEKAAFEFGQQLDLGAHGLFGYMLLSREDQVQLIETVVKHIRVCLPLLDMEVLRSGRDVVIRLHDTWEIGPARAFMAKIYMGSIHTVANNICGGIRFDCDFKTTLDTAEWSSLAQGTQWHFGSETNQVTLPQVKHSEQCEKLKVVYSLAESNHLKNANPTQSSSEKASNLAAKVREHIMKSPRHASIERSALLLNMSSRYLRQQLSEEGTSFREISNEIRQSYADLYLQDTPMPLHEIAYKLGFGDQASFTRAYRSWTGKTPGEIRRKAKKRDYDNLTT